MQEIRLAPLARGDLRAAHCRRASLRTGARRAAGATGAREDRRQSVLRDSVLFCARRRRTAHASIMTRDWSWDLDRIRAKGYTDNVVDLMVGKLSRLPVETRNALKQLACLGNSAEIRTIGSCVETPRSRCMQSAEAVRTRTVLAFGGAYRFIHDRVQEAAYSLDPGGPARRGASSNRQAARGAHASREARGGDLRDRQSAQPRRGLDRRHKTSASNSPSSI